MKLSVLYLVNIPSPYRVSFFNELGKYCDLTVVFERKESSEREKEWHDYNFENFKGVFLKEYPIKVINNGIDLEIFKPTKSNFREIYNIKDKFVILGVATAWGRNKGMDYFVELSRIINEDEVIVMVGLKEKQLKKLPRNIIGIARTNNAKELAEIYSDADVFINPTLSDTFPTTNLEALACGTPVITFDTGGSPECIDESCGFVVEKENLEELLVKIRVVKEKGKSNYSEECLQRAIFFYNKNDKFNEYIKTYSYLISKE